MKIYLLFYMCHFAMGLTHRYKTTVFFTFINFISPDFFVTICIITCLNDMAYLAVSLQQLIFLLYLPVKHTTVLCNDNGTMTSIINYELSHLA